MEHNYTKEIKAYALVLKRPRYGDDEKGDVVGIYLSRTLAKQARHPRYHKIVKVNITL